MASPARLKCSASQFPADFMFGTATSSYQIEGSAFGNCGPSHWDEFCNRKGVIADHSNGSIACDHYHQLEQDLDLIAALNLDAYRFSLSWPRLFPNDCATPNQEGFDFYDRLIDGLLERGIEPWACLYHWDLPLRHAQKGGWANREVSDRFAQYAFQIARHFGPRLKKIATINEPWCIAWLGYFTGQHAPGTKDLASFAQAMHNLLNAHAKAREAIDSIEQGKTGLIINLSHIIAATKSDQDEHAASLYEAFHNQWFLQALFKGSYPQQALAVIEKYLPQKWQDDMSAICSKPDWLGINYYACECVEHDNTRAFPNWRPSKAHNHPTTPMGWAIFPEGLQCVLQNTASEYSGNLPLYVTENGMGTIETANASSAVALNDVDRIAYIDAHLNAVQKAAKSGVPVKGYFVWSLMDNFEWSQGYGPRFGLYHTNYATMERTPKKSAIALSRFIKKRRTTIS